MGRTNLSPEKFFCSTLQTLLSQCIYGGKIDEFDQRLIYSFPDKLFTPASFDTEFALVAGAGTDGGRYREWDAGGDPQGSVPAVGGAAVGHTRHRPGWNCPTTPKSCCSPRAHGCDMAAVDADAKRHQGCLRHLGGDPSSVWSCQDAV